TAALVQLHEDRVRPRGVHRQPVDAKADLRSRFREVLRLEPAVDRLPGLAAVVGAEGAGRRDGDEHAPRVTGVQQDRVQSHAAGARLPPGAGAVAAEAGELVPGLTAVGGAEQSGVLHAGVDRVRIAQGRFDMPDALEFPRVLGAVVPLVRRERLAGFGRRVVDELVAFALGPALGRRGRLAGRRPGLVPGLSGVVGALDDLPEPAAGL